MAHPQVFPIPIPGQQGPQMHPQMQFPPGNPVQGFGHPAQHGHHAQQLMQLPLYIGFELVPVTDLEGKQSWSVFSPQQMVRTQEQFAEIVKKDKTKVKEAYQSKLVTGTQRRQIDRILEDHKRLERDPNLQWQLASIKLITKDRVSGLAKMVVPPSVVKIRVILKKIPQTLKNQTRRQSINLPLNGQHLMDPHQQIPGFQQQGMFNQQQQQANLFGEGMPPPPPMHHGGHPPEVIPLGRSSPDERWSDDDDHERRDRKDKKKDKLYKTRSNSPDIIIPKFKERRGSKSSSRHTTFDYDSDALSPLDSPITSLASSPRQWSDSRRRSSQMKKYHHSRRDSEFSKRDRRGSAGSNDSFVMVSKSHSRGKHGGSNSSYRSHSDYSQGHSPSRRHRGSSNRDNFDARALIRDMDRMRVSELERKTEDKRDLQHRVEINDRIRRLEDTVIHQNDQLRFGRPSLNRARTDRPSIGYRSSSRYDDDYLSFR